MHFRTTLRSDTEAIGDAGREVLDHHISLAHHIEQQRTPALGLEVQRDRLLVAVEHREWQRGATESGADAQVFATVRFDLDDLGTGERHQISRVGTVVDVREIDHDDAAQRIAVRRDLLSARGVTLAHDDPCAGRSLEGRSPATADAARAMRRSAAFKCGAIQHATVHTHRARGRLPGECRDHRMRREQLSLARCKDLIDRLDLRRVNRGLATEAGSRRFARFGDEGVGIAKVGEDCIDGRHASRRGREQAE